mmetsp:Transcript_25708/g.31541  ORF Transcript_25708/g.31541 Transcript_25708/m.31541 type:complete len:753 (+) Transcript_25708:96-2354(+)|eukprot:CAMPEP_0194361094 /NCGR_PEP_ID=MMETSP0174-20130528/8623_1 /TAXON_ID=216777 /ORGANISM="Proboscia alata, Strain PI-D3" /LENGTH=752 /DNA_ID=CAMNT_0039133083 /DNA_START=87 /DNA_END=2345 /DNA_ORIENTATION=+
MSHETGKASLLTMSRYSSSSCMHRNHFHRHSVNVSPTIAHARSISCRVFFSFIALLATNTITHVRAKGETIKKLEMVLENVQPGFDPALEKEEPSQLGVVPRTWSAQTAFFIKVSTINDYPEVAVQIDYDSHEYVMEAGSTNTLTIFFEEKIAIDTNNAESDIDWYNLFVEAPFEKAGNYWFNYLTKSNVVGIFDEVNKDNIIVRNRTATPSPPPTMQAQTIEDSDGGTVSEDPKGTSEEKRAPSNEKDPMPESNSLLGWPIYLALSLTALIVVVGSGMFFLIVKRKRSYEIDESYHPKMDNSDNDAFEFEEGDDEEMGSDYNRQPPTYARDVSDGNLGENDDVELDADNLGEDKSDTRKIIGNIPPTPLDHGIPYMHQNTYPVKNHSNIINMPQAPAPSPMVDDRPSLNKPNKPAPQSSTEKIREAKESDYYYGVKTVSDDTSVSVAPSIGSLRSLLDGIMDHTKTSGPVSTSSNANDNKQKTQPAPWEQTIKSAHERRDPNENDLINLSDSTSVTDGKSVASSDSRSSTGSSKLKPSSFAEGLIKGANTKPRREPSSLVISKRSLLEKRIDENAEYTDNNESNAGPESSDYVGDEGDGNQNVADDGSVSVNTTGSLGSLRSLIEGIIHHSKDKDEGEGADIKRQGTESIGRENPSSGNASTSNGNFGRPKDRQDKRMVYDITNAIQAKDNAGDAESAEDCSVSVTSGSVSADNFVNIKGDMYFVPKNAERKRKVTFKLDHLMCDLEDPVD